MGKYIKLFDTHSEYTAYISGNDAILPNVSYCVDANDVHYNPRDFSREYFTTIALQSGTITYEVVGNYDDELEREIGVSSEIFEKVAYSTDNGETWTQMINNSSEVGNIALSVNVNAGDKVMWKGKGVAVFDYNGDWDACTHFKSTCNVNVSGNILSMMLWDDFIGVSDISEDLAYGTFCAMFADPSAYVGCGEDTSEQGYPNFLHVVSAKDLCLPDVIMTENCYEELFYKCTTLVTAPSILPATTLSEWCYFATFQECTSLVNAPELPATTLATACYCAMFTDCTSLVTIPSILPATILADRCYEDMFRSCTSLVTAPELPATTLTSNCYQSMFQSCTSLVNAPELPATTLAEYCYSGMFYDCTALTTAPELPATTLASNCYQSMFNGCTSLTTAPELPATTLINWCYNSMFRGCTSLNYIKAMFTTTPSTSYYLHYWVDGVSATGTFVKNSAAQWNVTGIHGIPEGWTVQTASE